MTVNLTDTRDAQARGWGRPPVGSDHMVTVTAGGIAVPVHKRIAQIVSYCLDQTVARGYELHKGECWGYAPRHILNDPAKPWSNHAWGLAVDLNAPSNGYGAASGTFPARIAHQLWNRWGFRWGGDYHSTKDWMHVEFMGTKDDADTLIRKLGNGVVHRHPASTPAYPGHVLEPGRRGEHVRKVQLALKVHPDGVYGPHTAAAVKAFQRSHRGLRIDGVVGPATWERIFG